MRGDHEKVDGEGGMDKDSERVEEERRYEKGEG